MAEAVKEFEESFCSFLCPCVSSAFASLPAYLGDWSGDSLTGASLRSSVGTYRVAVAWLWPVSHSCLCDSQCWLFRCMSEMPEVDSGGPSTFFTHDTTLLNRKWLPLVGGNFDWENYMAQDSGRNINATVCSQSGDHGLSLLLLVWHQKSQEKKKPRKKKKKKSQESSFQGLRSLPSC